MLVKGLLDLIYNILDLILFTELPPMPEVIYTLLTEVTNYIVMGVDVLEAFIGHTAMLVLAAVISLVFAFNFFYLTWSMIFWILRKIPMLNIKE